MINEIFDIYCLRKRVFSSVFSDQLLALCLDDSGKEYVISMSQRKSAVAVQIRQQENTNNGTLLTQKVFQTNRTENNAPDTKGTKQTILKTTLLYSGCIAVCLDHTRYTVKYLRLLRCVQLSLWLGSP